MTTIPVPFAKVRDIFVDDPAAPFRGSHPAEGGRGQPFSTSLGVGLGAGASVHQEVTVHLGVPRDSEAAFVLPLTWRAAGHHQVLPTFSGELDASDGRPGTCLRLTGTYGVPLGVVGELGDDVVGHRLVRRSLEALMGELASRLEAKAAEGLDSGVLHREASSVEQSHPEIYVG
jgi:hypothetical protein